jgi:sRNA-binding carbon storage regulator CsrA
MALSLGVKAGSKITVGNHEVTVRSILKDLILISVDGGPDVVVSEQAREQILPEVWVFLGKPPSNPDHSSDSQRRLAFEAPRDIKILRQ